MIRAPAAQLWAAGAPVDSVMTPSDDSVSHTANDTAAVQLLFASLYTELHRLAQSHVRQGGAAMLGPTTLVHEAFVSIAERGQIAFDDRLRFFAYASRAMRGLLVDHARRRRASKRGGDVAHGVFDDDRQISSLWDDAPSLSALGDALQELEAFEPQLAELVDLHFFGGLSFGEIAALRSISERTVQREWKKARLLLHRLLVDHQRPHEGKDTAVTSTSEPPSE